MRTYNIHFYEEKKNIDSVFKPDWPLCHSHIFSCFGTEKNKFLHHLGAENLLQYWLKMGCDWLLLLAVQFSSQ